MCQIITLNKKDLLPISLAQKIRANNTIWIPPITGFCLFLFLSTTQRNWIVQIKFKAENFEYILVQKYSHYSYNKLSFQYPKIW